MNTFISILRGINITGNKIIRMTDLKAMYESLGFSDVTTYIQSGNVIFRSKNKNPAAVVETITGAIKTRFGFDVTVIIRRPDELKAVIKKNPFIGRKGIDEKGLYVTFLQEQPSPALAKALRPLTAKTKDEYEIVGTAIYIHCRKGYGKSLLNNSYFERYLKVRATTRNWNTVNILSSMADEAPYARN